MTTPDEPTLENSHPGPPRKPVVLTLVVGIVILALVGVGGYARRLSQQRAQLRGQLIAQERANVELREQLTKAEVAVQEKAAALASRESALADATQPELPVRVSFRPAWMGQGMVATFQNVGSRELNLMVEFRDANAHAERDFALVVAAGATAEVGHAQGWLVSSGQSVHVAASGYRSVTAFAP
ncbi:MAG TPA: hypothetical protein VIY54_04045 [Steroidobacteraceae bacterium]